jgi:hypothetical protein
LRAQAFPLGTPLALPLYKDDQEIDIRIFCAVLQGSHHERQTQKAKSLPAVLLELLLK